MNVGRHQAVRVHRHAHDGQVPGRLLIPDLDRDRQAAQRKLGPLTDPDEESRRLSAHNNLHPWEPGGLEDAPGKGPEAVVPSTIKIAGDGCTEPVWYRAWPLASGLALTIFPGLARTGNSGRGLIRRG